MFVGYMEGPAAGGFRIPAFSRSLNSASSAKSVPGGLSMAKEIGNDIFASVSLECLSTSPIGTVQSGQPDK